MSESIVPQADPDNDSEEIQVVQSTATAASGCSACARGLRPRRETARIAPIHPSDYWIIIKTKDFTNGQPPG